MENDVVVSRERRFDGTLSVGASSCPFDAAPPFTRVFALEWISILQLLVYLLGIVVSAQ
jgi:hypothetical protein